MKTKEIDSLLLKTRLPIGCPARSIRSICERKKFKANEWRNLAFYIALPVLQIFLPQKAFNNFAKYVIFLRMLCQSFISQAELIDAKAILIDFISEYQTIYGKDSMTSNIHMHIHLIKQVYLKAEISS